MKRFLGALLALLFVVAGLLAVALGSLGLAVFGTDGTYSTEGRSVASAPESVAIIADLTGVEIDIPYHERLGEATLSAQSADGSALFLGQAEQSAVDSYLFGVPYDLATKNGTWTLRPVPGVNTEIAPPADQTFWVQSSSGVAPSLTLQQQADPQTLVVMHADGSPAVAATMTVGFTGERIGPVSVALVAAGAVLILLTAIIVVRRRRRRRATKAAAVADETATATAPAPTHDGDTVLDLAAPAPTDVIDVGDGEFAVRPSDQSAT